MRLPVSPGLLFRPLTAEDVGDLCEILRDPVAMTAYEHAFTMEEVYTWLGRQQARYIRYGFGLWALLDSGTGAFVGQVGLTMQETPGGPELEIGYLLKRRFWHRGYASRAAASCRDFEFKEMDASRVVSIIRDTNEASKEWRKGLGCDRTIPSLSIITGWTCPISSMSSAVKIGLEKGKIRTANNQTGGWSAPDCPAEMPSGS